MPAGGGAELPEWTVPSGWQEQAARNMVAAEFTAGKAGEQAEITVSVFPGDVGGLTANVNRWRGQTGLAPLSEPEARKQLATLEMKDGEGQYVDVTGTRGGQPSRLVGVIVPRGGRTWFYKLMGNVSTVETEKEAFLKFVQGARHPQ